MLLARLLPILAFYALAVPDGVYADTPLFFRTCKLNTRLSANATGLDWQRFFESHVPVLGNKTAMPGIALDHAAITSSRGYNVPIHRLPTYETRSSWAAWANREALHLYFDIHLVSGEYMACSTTPQLDTTILPSLLQYTASANSGCHRGADPGNARWSSILADLARYAADHCDAVFVLHVNIAHIQSTAARLQFVGSTAAMLGSALHEYIPGATSPSADQLADRRTPFLLETTPTVPNAIYAWPSQTRQGVAAKQLSKTIQCRLPRGSLVHEDATIFKADTKILYNGPQTVGMLTPQQAMSATGCGYTIKNRQANPIRTASLTWALRGMRAAIPPLCASETDESVVAFYVNARTKVWSNVAPASYAFLCKHGNASFVQGEWTKIDQSVTGVPSGMHCYPSTAADLHDATVFASSLRIGTIQFRVSMKQTFRSRVCFPKPHKMMPIGYRIPAILDTPECSLWNRETVRPDLTYQACRVAYGKAQALPTPVPSPATSNNTNSSSTFGDLKNAIDQSPEAQVAILVVFLIISVLIGAGIGFYIYRRRKRIRAGMHEPMESESIISANHARGGHHSETTYGESAHQDNTLVEGDINLLHARISDNSDSDQL